MMLSLTWSQIPVKNQTRQEIKAKMEGIPRQDLFVEAQAEVLEYLSEHFQGPYRASGLYEVSEERGLSGKRL